MKRFLDALFTAMALVLAIPTLLILISWNAIPGDRLYALKTGLEDVVIVVFSGTPLVPEVSMQFTDRRFNEATALLSKKGSTVGYELLVAEAQQTQGFMTEKKDSTGSVKFVQNIETYKKEIQKQKVQVQAQIDSGQETPVTQSNAAPTVINIATPIPVVAPVPSASEAPAAPVSQTVTVTVPTQVVITHEDPHEVLQHLDEAEQHLNQIQQEVEHEHNNNFPNSGNFNFGNGNGNGDQNSNRGNR